MTRLRCIGEDTPAIAWVRAHRRLDSQEACLDRQDIDLEITTLDEEEAGLHAFNRYDRGIIQLVEIKTNGATSSQAQADTRQILDQLLRLGSELRRPIATMRGRRLYYYYGYHVWRLSGTNPDDSEWMTWDEYQITAGELLCLLRAEMTAAHLKARQREAQP